MEATGGIKEILSESDAISYFEQAVKSSRGNYGKKEQDSFSLFSFTTPSEFLAFFQKNIKPAFQNIMGSPQLTGDYFTFTSPFKALFGETDRTASFQFRWKDGYWFDNTSVAQGLFHEHYPEKRVAENPANGNIALFLAICGNTAKPSFELRDSTDRSKGFKVFRHDTDLYRKIFTDALRAISPEEAHKVVHYIHQECLAAKIMLREPSHYELLKSRKPVWAERLNELLKCDSVGYFPSEHCFIFFYVAPDGNFDYTVKKYNLKATDRNGKHFHASIFTLIEGSPVFGELSKTNLTEGSVFFASTSCNLSRERGNLITTIKKHVVPQEIIPSSTVFFTEGEPDAVTLALFGYSACNFRFQLEDGKIRKESVIREFGVYTDNVIFSDTGDTGDTGKSTQFGRALGNLAKENSRKNSIINLDVSDFPENSRFILSSDGTDVKVLDKNVDITNLIEDKFSGKGLNSNEYDSEVRAELIRLRTKEVAISYTLSSTISFDTIIPLGSFVHTRKLRELRHEQLVNFAKANTAKMLQIISGIGEQGNLALHVPDSLIEESAFAASCTLPIRISRQSNSMFAMRLSQTSFDCSALSAGLQEKGKKCESCPVWAMRQDLGEIDFTFGEASKANNFLKVPTIMGRTHAGSRFDLRMVPSFASGSARKKEEIQPLQGMTCNPRLPFTVEEEALFVGQVEIGGSIKPIYVYYDSIFMSPETLAKKIGSLQQCTGYFAKVFVKSEKKIEILPVFVICKTERSDFEDSYQRIKIEERRQHLAIDKTVLSATENFFDVALEEKTTPEKIMPSVEKIDAILTKTLNEIFQRMGSFSNIRATLAMFLSANSGTFVKNVTGQAYYVGFSCGVYGLPSCGKTHIARTMLCMFNSHNYAHSPATAQGIMQAINAKLTTFVPSGTGKGENRYVPPVPSQYDGDFYVFDEAHGGSMGSKNTYHIFDPLLSLTWDGSCVITGTFAASAASNSETNINNSEALPARCPFIFLGNLELKSNSFSSLYDGSRDKRRDMDTRRAYERELTDLPSIFGFPDISAFHKRVLMLWAYPRDSYINQDDYQEFRKKCLKIGIPEEEIVLANEVNLLSPLHLLQEFYHSLQRAFTQFRLTRMTTGVVVSYEAEKLSYQFAEKFLSTVVDQTIRIDRGYEKEGIARRIIGIANVCSLIRCDNIISDKDVIYAYELLCFLWRDVQEIDDSNRSNVEEIVRQLTKPKEVPYVRGEGMEYPFRYPFMRYLVLDVYGDEHEFKSYTEIKMMVDMYRDSRKGTYSFPAQILSEIESHNKRLRGETIKVGSLTSLEKMFAEGVSPDKHFEILFGMRGVQNVRTKDFIVPQEYISGIMRTVEYLVSSNYIKK